MEQPDIFVEIAQTRNRGQNNTTVCNGNGREQAFVSEFMNVEFDNNIGKEQAFVSKSRNVEFDSDSWIVDSGATDHMTHCNRWFFSYKSFEIPLEIGDKSTMTTLGRGNIKFET